MRLDLPEIFRLFGKKLNSGDGLRALVTVIPRNNNPHRSTMLPQKMFAINPSDHHGESVHCFIHPQAFMVGPGYEGELFKPGISSGRLALTKRTNLAELFGSTFLMSLLRGKPLKGMFMAHRSTQRKW